MKITVIHGSMRKGNSATYDVEFVGGNANID